MTSKIFTVAHLPDALVQKWLQHLRDFDSANPSCHFEVFAEPPDVSINDAIRLLQVEPGLTFSKIFERKR